MKYLIALLLFLFLFTDCFAQTVTHHVDGQGRKVQIHTFHKPNRDSVICYVYGRPGRWDRPLISLTKRGEAYDHLLFILQRKRKKTKYWSFFEASPMNKARCSSRKSKTSEK
jgi:hypothetical protein